MSLHQANRASPQAAFGGVTLVVPLYNEAENIPRLVAEIIECKLPEIPGFELLFVDDGSTDESPVAIAELGRQYGFIRAIRFEANAGKSAAWDAGLARARGEFVVTMDSDIHSCVGPHYRSKAELLADLTRYAKESWGMES